ncbi:MAG TPA: Gfo/Idh/MocA family oxidoreductase [Candidatus Limnocylindrales bacterium]|nr:Gfo/Idh/MocA family oxidoreductase [Candidatus Limnocylindrales bacterium]
MASRLRVAVVGAGFIGADHAAAYARRDDVELVGIADADPARARDVAARFGTASFGSAEDAIERTRPDAVSVCVPTGLHRGVVEIAAAAGAHVLLEKPMARSVEECDAITEAARNARILLMLGLTHRFHAELQLAKSLIDEGRLGQPMLAQDVFSFGEHGPWPAWYYDRSLSGGGELMHDGVHLVDRLAWLLGSPVVEVFGRTTSYARGIDGVEDGGVAVLRFASGALATLFVNEATFPIRSDAPSVPMPGRCELEIHGARGSIRYRTWHELIVDLAGEPSRTIAYGDGRELDREIAEFVTAVDQGRPPSVGGAEGRRGIAVVQAIYASERLGRPVTIVEPTPVPEVAAPAGVTPDPLAS